MKLIVVDSDHSKPDFVTFILVDEEEQRDFAVQEHVDGTFVAYEVIGPECEYVEIEDPILINALLRAIGSCLLRAIEV